MYVLTEVRTFGLSVETPHLFLVELRVGTERKTRSPGETSRGVSGGWELVGGGVSVRDPRLLTEQVDL